MRNYYEIFVEISQGKKWLGGATSTLDIRFQGTRCESVDGTQLAHDMVQ